MPKPFLLVCFRVVRGSKRTHLVWKASSVTSLASLQEPQLHTGIMGDDVCFPELFYVREIWGHDV
jgi:hypothetical protein